MTNEQIQKKIDEIQEQYSPNIRTYTIDGETITFSSPAEVISYIKMLRQMIAAANHRTFSVSKPRGNAAL